MNKTTEELINEIVSAKTIEEFVEENKEEFIDMSLAEYLNLMLEEHNTDKRSVFKRAGMLDSNYGYEVFSGEKSNVSRDKLIQLALGFPLSVEECYKLLRLGKVSPLYPRTLRDAYIMYALKNGTTIEKLNDLLFEKGEKTIL